jgi:hypothetical protein
MQKDVEDMEPKAESVLTTMLSEIQGMPKEKLAEAIGQEAESRGHGMIRLGGLLDRLARFVYGGDGDMSPSTFLDHCRNQYGIDREQIRVYRRAYRVAALSGLDLDELSQLDTHKLTKLLPQVIEPMPKSTLGPASPGNKETYNANKKWLDKALEMSRVELAAAIAKEKGKSAATAKQYVFKVKEDAEVIDAAFEKIKKDTEGKHVGAAALVDMANAINAGGKVPTLALMMKQAGPIEAIETFSKLWPEINVTVTMP